MKESTKKIVNKSAVLGVGVLAGSGLNSLGSKIPIAGMNNTAFMVGTLPVTYNDVMGAVVSGAAAVYGWKKKRPVVKMVGIGMVAGVALNKTAQYYGFGLSAPTAASSFRMVNNTMPLGLGTRNMAGMQGIATQITKGRYVVG